MIRCRDDNTKLIIPYAPRRRNPAIGLRCQSPTWFNYVSDHSGEAVRDGVNHAHLAAQVVRILDYIQCENVKVGVCGYSQGGCLALEVTKAYEKLGGSLWFCHCSRSLNLTDDVYVFRTPVMITLAAQDEVFQHEFTKQTYQCTNAIVRSFDMNHTEEFPPEEEFVCNWYNSL